MIFIQTGPCVLQYMLTTLSIAPAGGFLCVLTVAYGRCQLGVPCFDYGGKWNYRVDATANLYELYCRRNRRALGTMCKWNIIRRPKAGVKSRHKGFRIYTFEQQSELSRHQMQFTWRTFEIRTRQEQKGSQDTRTVYYCGASQCNIFSVCFSVSFMLRSCFSFC